MQFIDMHCDTLMYSYDRPEYDIYKSEQMLDLLRMKKGGQMAQFFAMYMLSELGKKKFCIDHPLDDDEYVDQVSTNLKRYVERHNDLIAMAYSADDIQTNWEAGKMSAILTIENGRVADGKLEKIKKFYDIGVRAIALTHNQKNCFGSPNSTDPVVMAEGLTEFGKSAVVYMQELGMLVDVSHLSDGGFWDVVQLSKTPFVATHSNCRALAPHQRNLTDEMIRALAEKGGVSGINFGPEFLTADTKATVQRVDSMISHIQHFINVGGIDCVGLGSDFDGIRGDLEIGSSDKVPLLFDAMGRAGFSDDQIEKLAYKNVLRVMKESVK